MSWLSDKELGLEQLQGQSMDTELKSEVNSPQSSCSPACQFPQTLPGTQSWVAFVRLNCSFKSSLGSCISKLQALQILDPCGLKSEGSTHGIRGNKELEESSYCPQRTRRVSKETEGLQSGCCRDIKGLKDWGWVTGLDPAKKVTDFRMHTQYIVRKGACWARSVCRCLIWQG